MTLPNTNGGRRGLLFAGTFSITGLELRSTSSTVFSFNFVEKREKLLRVLVDVCLEYLNERLLRVNMTKFLFLKMQELFY
jgi:hypothetical protein